MRTGTDDKPLTRKEADELKEYETQKFMSVAGYAPKFTCETCVMLAWCEFAYDAYNQNGDCLADK